MHVVHSRNIGQIYLETYLKTRHKKNVQGENSSSEITNLVLQPSSEGHEAHAAEGNFAFYCVTNHKHVSKHQTSRHKNRLLGSYDQGGYRTGLAS
jgi:hypothetical protein